MIICCSIHDIEKYAKGTIYRTAVGGGQGMSAYKGLPFLYPLYTEMVDAHKKRIISDEQYRLMYKQLLGSRWSQVEEWLKGLRADEDSTLLCFCSEGAFCHRRQIAAMIKVYRPDLEVITH